MKPLLHPSTQAQIQSIIRKPKGAYLFVGAAGVGRLTSAIWLAQQLHCGGQTNCQVCHLIATRAYGDLIVLEPQDSGSIGIAQTHELLSALGKSKLELTGVRMVIIDQADRLTVEAQNSLLKTIEEPPEATMIVMVVSDTAALLETIKSRSEVVFFPSLTDAQIASHLQTEFKLTSEQASAVALLSLGAIGTARTLATDTDQLQKLQDAEALIDRIESGGEFERLLIASKLQEGSIETMRFVGLLARRLQQHLREVTTQDVADKVLALERFERYIKANVNGRSAWSRLLLEL